MPPLKLFKKYNLLQRHKYMLVSLVIYWPLIFICTHIPVPQIVGSMGMTDKTLHYLAYLVLVTFLWQTVSPYKKINWKQAKVWIILAIIIWYGACDEWLQGYVNRTPDVMDFRADFAGAMTGLILFSIFSFWPALLAVVSIIVFTATNLTKYQIMLGSEIVNIGFYFVSYALLSLIWIHIVRQQLNLTKQDLKWWAVSLTVPVGILVAVSLCSLAIGKGVWVYDITSAAVGVLMATTIAAIICSKHKKSTH